MNKRAAGGILAALIVSLRFTSATACGTAALQVIRFYRLFASQTGRFGKAEPDSDINPTPNLLIF